MSAAEHPAGSRACWCNTHRAKWGCHIHGPTPLARDEWLDCRLCLCATKNVDEQCDPCIIRFASMEAQLDGAREIRWLVRRLQFNDIPDRAA